MRLKHLELQGYKTFAKKTEFLLPSGITAIVGPNGSGKSNVVDAVRWVLGEQSYSTLRGKRTEDMIFSGSQSRPRAGMAEVTLTLDNADNWLPIDYSEVMIGRRAFRDGQNEYYINNNRVRLRDVQELLSQSGLSRRTYTVIGQGVVDSVLSLRAEERRELFEEAAGIAHYQDKREDALGKLDDTKRNLERVHDIISEIEPRLNRLQKQADRAREHGKLSSDLQQQSRVWYGYRWGQVATTFNRAQRLARQHTEQHDKLVQGFQELTDQIDRTREDQNTLRGKLGDWHHESGLLHGRAEQDQRELAVLTERIHQLGVQREEHATEITALDARIASLVERIGQTKSDLADAEQTVAQREREALAANEALRIRMEERDELQRTVDEIGDQQITLRTEIAERRSRREILAERIDALAVRIYENHEALSRLGGEKQIRTEQVSKVDHELSRLETQRTRLLESLQGLDSRRQSLDQRFEQHQTTLRELREQEQAVAARFDLLNQLRRDFAVYNQASRALLVGDGALGESRRLPFSGVQGVLAQLIRIPVDGSKEVSTAVEAALGAYASAVIVADWQTATRALQYVRDAGLDGRVLLLALDSAVTGTHHSGAHLQSEDGVIGPLANFVDCEKPVRPLINHLLGHAYLAPDLEVARAQRAKYPARTIWVTVRGDVLRENGVMEGGRAAEQITPFAQEREWSQLSAHRIELGARREVLEKDIAELRSELETLERQIEQRTAGLERLDSQRATIQALRARLTSQIDRLQQEIDWRQAQMADDGEDQHELEQRQRELSHEIEALAQAQTEAAERIKELRSKLGHLPTERLQEELASAQMAVAVARQTWQGTHDILQELEHNLGRLEQQQQTHRQRVVALQDEENKVSERTAQLHESQGELNDRLASLTAYIEPTEAELVALEARQKELEAEERIERARLRESESQLANSRLEVQRREDEMVQLRNRIEEDLGLVELELGSTISGQAPLPLHPVVSQLPVVQQLPQGVEEEIKRLRAQIRRLGAINPNAPDEYQEIRDRYDFLETQSTDLVEASESLHKIIDEMDGLIEHAFRQTFEAVAKEFSRNFVALFGGGQAQLKLTDPEDPAQTGVEIVAQPPGKRLQALTSLSGGERALTAVALIFAVLQVSPPPFCFLDEVDAMLDEANIGRFRALLEALTGQTQIVIITHNRGTVAAADTVYGVSMGADSVSQVYSIRMEGEKIQEP